MRYTVYGNERIDRELPYEGEEMTAAEAVAAFVEAYGFIPDGVLREDEGEGEAYRDCMGLCENCGLGLFAGEYVEDTDGVKWHRKGFPCPERERAPEHGMGFGLFTEGLIEDGLIDPPSAEEMSRYEQRDRREGPDLSDTELASERGYDGDV